MYRVDVMLQKKRKLLPPRVPTPVLQSFLVLKQNYGDEMKRSMEKLINCDLVEF